MDSYFAAIFGSFVCIALAVASGTNLVVSDTFRVKSNDAEAFENEEHLRSRREVDISKIKHLYNEKRVNHFSPEEKQAILDKHLEFRSSVDPEASNMEYMVWNDDLAALAELYASVCFFGHGFTNHTDIINTFPSIGQNLWLGSEKPPGPEQVANWYSEEDNYVYETKTCTGTCGHYTQVVWATSDELGCGRAYCAETIDNNGDRNEDYSDVFIFACHYAPSGNAVGIKPYISGESCSQCRTDSDVCVNNMCAEMMDVSPSTSMTTASSLDSTSSTASSRTDDPLYETEESAGTKLTGVASAVIVSLIMAFLAAI